MKHPLILGGAHPFEGNPRSSEGDVWLDGLRHGMGPLVRGWKEADPNFWMSPGERERWLASDAEALAAARRQRLTEPSLSEDSAAAIPVPALLYAGAADDWAAPDTVERAARLMPDAAFVALGGLDHAQGLTRSDLVMAHALAFLARAESAAATRS